MITFGQGLLFGFFYKDFDAEVSHRLRIEYKPNISHGIPIRRRVIFVSVATGVVDGIFTCLSYSFLQNNDKGQPVDGDQLAFFLSLSYSLCFFLKVCIRITSLNPFILLIALLDFILLLNFTSTATSWGMLDMLLGNASLFFGIWFLCMTSFLIEFSIVRAFPLVLQSARDRLDYILEEEERAAYEYLEGSDYESEPEDELEEKIESYKVCNQELKAKNLG